MNHESIARRPNSRTERTYAGIVQAAAELLATSAPGTVTVDEVAASAGVKKGTIYYHFRSQEALFFSVLEVHARDRVAAVRSLSSQSAPPLEIVRSILQDAIRRVIDPRQRFLYHLALLPLSPEMRRYMNEADSEYARLLAAAIEGAQHDGVVIEGDPLTMSRILLGAIARTGLWYDLSGPLPPSEFAGLLDRMLQGGLLVRRPFDQASVDRSSDQATAKEANGVPGPSSIIGTR